MIDNVLSTAGSILSAGFVALDVIIHEDYLGHAAGGTAGNVAANLSFFGWRSAVAGVIGDDPAGQHLVADFFAAGVDVSNLQVVADASTPVVIHEILTDTHRFRFGCPRCGRRFPRSRPLGVAAAATLVLGATPDVFFFDRVSSAALLIANHVRERGGLVVFEPATPGRNGYFRRAMALAHLVKYSDHGESGLGDLLRPSALQLHIRTEGAAGASWRKGSGQWRKSPAVSDIDVVDAGGAGDWTTAALLASLGTLKPAAVLDLDLTGPLSAAQAVAALSCRSVGARGLAHDLTRDEVTDAARQLVGPRPAVTKRPAAPAHAPRRASCGACLSGTP